MYTVLNSLKAEWNEYVIIVTINSLEDVRGNRKVGVRAMGNLMILILPSSHSSLKDQMESELYI